MTAGHCMVAGRDATFVAVDVDVATVRDDKGKAILDKDGNPIVTRLPPAQQLRMNVAIDDVWPTEGTGEDDRDPTDYSFIHMAPAGDNHMLSVFLTQLDKDAPFEQCSQPVPKEMAVAVIARHVNNSTKVYDSAHVLFPFAMSVSSFGEFSMETGLAIQRFVDENFEEGQRDEEFNTRMTAFEDAYVSQPDGVYEFRMQRTGFGAKRPYMGMDTDTIHGNSGGPVYLRHRPCVVGVFSGGEPDRAVYTVGDWSRHEYATPLSEVKADLKGRAVPADMPDDMKARRQALYTLMLESADGTTPQ